MLGCFASQEALSENNAAVAEDGREPDIKADEALPPDHGEKAAKRGKGDNARTRLEERGLERKTHLIIMVNGLGGSYRDWDGLCQVMSRSDSGLEHMALVPSMANNGKLTVDGIQVCGKRLADEIHQLVLRGKDLRGITFICHSLGGLIARYALGLLYDSSTGLVGGLEPRHFITVATPHLGCDRDGEALVPVFGWLGAVPLIGKAADKAMKAAAAPVTRSIAGVTGTQLFRQDGNPEEGQEPILSTITKGIYIDALGAFASRTAYANSWGDTIVGWANSSLRHLSELPNLAVLGNSKSVGLNSHWAPDTPRKPTGGSHQGPEFPTPESRSDIKSSESLSAPTELTGSAGHVPNATEHEIATEPERQPQQELLPAARMSAGEENGARVNDIAENSDHQVVSAAPLAGLPPIAVKSGPNEVDQGNVPRSFALRKSKIRVNTYTDDLTYEMLSRLQTLTWNRVDLTFKNAFHAMDSHNHIKASKNKGVARHIVQLLNDMEAVQRKDTAASQRLAETFSMSCELDSDDEEDVEGIDAAEERKAVEFEEQDSDGLR